MRCPACGEAFTVSEAFTASEVTIDTAPDAVSVDTTELANRETLDNVAGPADQNREEATLRKLGRFELKSVLGAGGFGKVYRAFDPQLERFVALKVPTFGPNQKTRIQRFLTEAKAAARLKHANIVTTFESGKADKKYYIASEYIEGELLSKLTKKERPSIEDSVQIVRKLAEALAYAHSQGVVHRDVKPHNVMIDTNSEPQLMDFGLAKRTDDSSNLTTDGALLGTPAYMSPEQARGELHLVNPLSDQYSLGVVLYHLLTGGTPCEGSPHMVIAEVAKGEFHSVRDWNSRIDHTLDAVCQKAMHPEQCHRYTDCSQFAADLDAWASEKPVLARPLTKLQKLGRTLANHQLVVGLFSIILVLFFSAALLGYRLLRSDNTVTQTRASVTPTKAADEEVHAERKGDHDLSRAAGAVKSPPATDLIAMAGTKSATRANGVEFLANELHLTCGQQGDAILDLSHSIPDEFEFTLEAVRTTPFGMLAITFPHQRSDVTLILGGSKGLANSGLSDVDGKFLAHNALFAGTAGPFWRGSRKIQIVSRKDAIEVLVDGEQFIEYRGAAEKLTSSPRFTKDRKSEDLRILARNLANGNGHFKVSRMSLASVSPISTTSRPIKRQQNLMAGIEVDDCCLQGSVFLEGGTLVLHHANSPASEEAIVELPFLLPDEYDVTLEVTKSTDRGCLVICMPHRDVSTSVVLDGKGGSGITHKNGSYHDNATTVRGEKVFSEVSIPRTIRIQSREGILSVFVDEERLTQFEGGSSALSVDRYSTHPNGRALAIKAAHQGRFAVTRVSIEAEHEAVSAIPAQVRSPESLVSIVSTTEQTDRIADVIERKSGSLRSTSGADQSFTQTLTLDLSGFHNISVDDLQAISSVQVLDCIHLDETSIETVDPSVLRELKELDKMTLRNATFDTSFLTALTSLNSIQHLDLSHCDLSDAAIDVVCRLSSLETLRVDGCRLNAASLIRLIESLPKLWLLSAEDQQVSEDNVGTVLTALESASQITRVSFRHWTGLNDSHLEQLKRMKHLRVLNVDRTPLTDAAVTSLQKALPDTRFEARRTTIPPIDVVPVHERYSEGQLDALIASHGPGMVDVLDIPSHSAATGVEVMLQEDGMSLLRIDFGRDSNITARDILNIAKLTGPVEIHTNFGGAGPVRDHRLFAALARMPKLVKLDVDNDHYFGAAHFEALSINKSLEELICCFQGMSLSEFQSLAKITSLQRLNASGTNLDNAKLRVLCSGLTNLVELLINNWSSGRHTFDDHGAAELLKLSKLEKLSLKDCDRLTDQCISVLAQMNSLKSLDVTNTSITKQGVERLRLALPNATITAKDPADGGIDAASLQKLSQRHKRQTCAWFTGNDAFLTLGRFDADPITGITFEAWARPVTFSFTSKWGDEVFGLHQGTDLRSLAHLRVTRDLYWAFQCTNGHFTDSGGCWMAVQTSDLRPFVHLAAVFESGNASFFVNGKQIHRKTVYAPEAGDEVWHVWLAAHRGRYFQGLIDEVRISNTARYSENFTPLREFTSDDRTLALYHFDANPWGIAYDHGPYGRHLETKANFVDTGESSPSSDSTGSATWDDYLSNLTVVALQELPVPQRVDPESED